LIALSLDRVSVRYLATPVFENLSWEIHDDRVVGLIGPNGCGKSTLLRLIQGQLKSDTGFIVGQKELTIGYLPQEPQLDSGNTLWEEVITASTALARVDAELTRVEDRLADPQVYNNEKKLAHTLDYQARLLDEYTQLGGPGHEGHVRSILLALGFQKKDFALSVDVLSGGQKKLAGLAKLLIVKPKLLLLDEPDNHLDLQGKTYLEKFIRNYPGGVVIVSHDRYLLDLVIDEIVELEDGHLTQYPGNYSEYAFEKETRLLRQKQLFQVQQKEISRLEQAAKRLLTWGDVYDNEKFIKRGKNILKRLERMDKLDKPILERKRMGLALSGWRGSNKVLEIIDLDKVFPATDSIEENNILVGLDLLIWRGERVGLVGPNGSGKSLLFRMILEQEDPSGGVIYLGPSVTIGFYTQEHENLDYHRTLIDTVRYAAPLSEANAVAFLGRFLFTYEQARSLVSSLSGGERSRLQMALLMLTGANFLLLDEPTNNLDIGSAEVLENVVEDFEGTVLVISHDRYFLDRTTNRIVELDNGAFNEYRGNYSDYQAAKNKQTLPKLPKEENK